MELLSTVHWVATRIPQAKTLDGAIRAVHGWNERKEKLMSPDHIRLAWHHLAEHQWIAA
jgi:hypothetical protein